MKNMLAEPKQHKTLAYGLGVLPATVVLIFYYLLKLLVKFLMKFKRQLWRASVMTGVVFFLTAFFMPVVYSPKADASLLPETPVVIQEDTKEDIEVYIKTIFGKDAKTATAISHAECNPLNRQYPACVYHTDREYSVGIFQINLYNKDQWIHAGRIPGKTMDEKVEWLKEPSNNTLYAYWVFQKSGWNPWSTYTNGAYLNN